MSGRTKEETAGITHLGSQGTKYDFNYCPEVLETFINKHPDHDYFVKFNCPEDTVLQHADRSLRFCQNQWHSY